MLERRIEGDVPAIGVSRVSGEAAWKGVRRGGRVEGGRRRSAARLRQARHDAGGADAGAGGDGVKRRARDAMPSGGRRAVAGAFAFDHGERPRVFGDGAKHRAGASNVATLEESANDEGAKRRVVRRETHGGAGGTIATESSEAAKWRARDGDAIRRMASREVRSIQRLSGEQASVRAEPRMRRAGRGAATGGLVPAASGSASGDGA